jgi:hypothetical protein
MYFLRDTGAILSAAALLIAFDRASLFGRAAAT